MAAVSSCSELDGTEAEDDVGDVADAGVVVGDDTMVAVVFMKRKIERFCVW